MPWVSLMSMPGAAQLGTPVVPQAPSLPDFLGALLSGAATPAPEQQQQEQQASPQGSDSVKTLLEEIEALLRAVEVNSEL